MHANCITGRFKESYINIFNAVLFTISLNCPESQRNFDILGYEALIYIPRVFIILSINLTETQKMCGTLLTIFFLYSVISENEYG